MPTREYDIDERVFRFTCDVIAFVRTIQWEPGVREVVEQLVAAAGSTGANRHEATAAAPGKEFIHYNTISLREARESHYWLRVCQATQLGDQTLCGPLVGEADQIKRILGAIVVNAKASLQRKAKQAKSRESASAADK